jgi:ketosteroid isomerase-like protein
MPPPFSNELMKLRCFQSLVCMLALNIAASAFAAGNDAATLKHQSQEFSDASARGDAKVLDKYLDDNVVFMDESGTISTKHDIVSGAAPPTEGIDNKLVQSDFAVSLHGDVAVTSFTDNSTVNVYGQASNARYRSIEVWLKKGGRWKMISSQTLALPDDPPAVQLTAAAIDQYAGTYDAGPKLVVKIERQGEGLVSTTNGGKITALLVEALDVLFTPGQPRIRRIFERDANGKITGFNARREGHDLHFDRRL